MPKDLTFEDIKTILAAALGIRAWNIDDVSGGFVYYTPETATGVRGTYKRSYVIGESAAGDTQVTLGDPMQVVKRAVYEPLVIVSQFALEGEATFSAEDPNTVLRTGKLFEAGDYPDKGFSITEEEMDTAIANFSPVPNNLEHRPTILSGSIGQLQSVNYSIPENRREL